MSKEKARYLCTHHGITVILQDGGIVLADETVYPRDTTITPPPCILYSMSAKEEIKEGRFGECYIVKDEIGWKESERGKTEGEAKGITSSVIEERKTTKVEFTVAADLWRNFSAICEQRGTIPGEVLPLLIREGINMQATRIKRENIIR